MDDISTRVQEIIDQVRDKSPGKVCPVTSGKRIIGQVKVMRGGFLWLFKRIEVTFFSNEKATAGADNGDSTRNIKQKYTIRINPNTDDHITVATSIAEKI